MTEQRKSVFIGLIIELFDRYHTGEVPVTEIRRIIEQILKEKEEETECLH